MKNMSVENIKYVRSVEYHLVSFHGFGLIMNYKLLLYYSS